MFGRFERFGLVLSNRDHSIHTALVEHTEQHSYSYGASGPPQLPTIPIAIPVGNPIASPLAIPIAMGPPGLPSYQLFL